MRGERVNELPAELRLIVESTGSVTAKANVVIAPFGWHIISRELADPLEKTAKGDVELLSVCVCYNDGKVVPKDFFVINALRVVDALSENKTIRARAQLGIPGPVFKPCIVSKCVPSDLHVFRIRGDEMRLFVDDIGKNALSSAQHDGLRFLPVLTE